MHSGDTIALVKPTTAFVLSCECPAATKSFGLGINKRVDYGPHSSDIDQLVCSMHSWMLFIRIQPIRLLHIFQGTACRSSPL